MSEQIKLKLERIENRKLEIGSKHRRKLNKHSDRFNKIFNFFLITNRRKLLNFCGSKVEVFLDIKGPDSREGFRLYDDGFYKNKLITSRHPNILKCIIVSKKAWGLWVQEWTDGIVECSFTKEEILSQFDGIEIPESFINDFNNVIEQKKIKRNKKYLEEIQSFKIK